MNAKTKTQAEKEVEQIHVEAFDLRSELFRLANKIKDLQARAQKFDNDDAGQLDAVACQLAEIHAALPWVFVAAAAEQ